MFPLADDHNMGEKTQYVKRYKVSVISHRKMNNGGLYRIDFVF